MGKILDDFENVVAAMDAKYEKAWAIIKLQEVQISQQDQLIQGLKEELAVSRNRKRMWWQK